jgi:hypothetical protein
VLPNASGRGKPVQSGDDFEAVKDFSVGVEKSELFRRVSRRRAEGIGMGAEGGRWRRRRVGYPRRGKGIVLEGYADSPGGERDGGEEEGLAPEVYGDSLWWVCR